MFLILFAVLANTRYIEVLFVNELIDMLFLLLCESLLFKTNDYQSSGLPHFISCLLFFRQMAFSHLYCYTLYIVLSLF